jgi:urease subunit alpha
VVLWKPAFFGAKPALIIKGGFIVAAPMGDANASIPTPQPVHSRPMFGSFGAARSDTCVHFTSQAALEHDLRGELGLSRRLVRSEVRAACARKDLIHNGYCPRIEVDSQTYQVRADGQLLVCEPARELPLAQRYFLF